MPLWLVLLLAGSVLAVLGFAGVGAVLLWVGAAVVVSGVVLALRSVAVARRGPPRTRTSAGSRLSWQRRTTRLGWVVLGLSVLSVALLVTAVWMVESGRPRVVPGTPQRAVEAIAVLPLGVEVAVPRPAVVLGLGLALAAFVAAMAALEAATAVRVLSRGRGLEQPVARDEARLGRRVLGPAVTRALELDGPPQWPVTAIPAEADVEGLVLRCTVLVPAHDEEAILAQTLASLEHQTRPPDRVLVVADNCTDGTVRIAQERGVEVVETVGNTQHKAGALNQVLARLLPAAGVEDVFLVMDADSTIGPDFLSAAVGLLEEDRDLMAVGGLFSGEEGARILGQMQRNEFFRYQRVIDRREGRLFVLTGTASLFRGYALRAVAEARGSLVPGVAGGVYDTSAMTEDNELTLALKSLGAGLTSPPQCRVTTEVMPSWRDLWRQRLRWQRGALENVGAYGFTRTTARYWWQQLSLGYGVVALNSYLLLVTISLLASDAIRWSPVWAAIGAIFVLERVVTAWAAGWRGRAVALPLVFELGYALVLQATFVASLVQIGRRQKAGWNYVPREVVAGAALPALAGVALVGGWSPLPATVLESGFVEALSLFVAVNTLVFATLSVFQMLPPIHRTARRLQRRVAGRQRQAASVP
ncbi:glycosyltransferase family 2 protein [Cellulomonas sp. URHB0016]